MRFAHFLDGPRGRLFSVGFRPTDRARPRHWVLVVPPLLEELNKSRRTLALLGRGLTGQGLGTLLPDLYGTGDSEGEVGDATWETWIGDLDAAHAWLLGQGATRIDLLALRGGALLGWAWLAVARPQIGRLILWQPTPDGRQLVHHLLRLRLAADLMGRGSGETAASLRRRLAADGALEIAGYRLSAALLASIEGASLAAASPRQVGRVDWYQVISAPGQALPPGVHQSARAWSDAGLPTRVVTVEGDAFWATAEIVEGTSLIAATIHRAADPEAGHDSP